MLRISTLSRLLALSVVLPAAVQAQTTTQATPQAIGAPPATSGTSIGVGGATGVIATGSKTTLDNSPTAQPTTTTARAASAPPNIVGDDSLAPAVKIPPRRKDRKIVEKKENGRTTEVQVTTGGSSYILKPNTQPGSLPGDNVRGAMRPPQWVVKEFNLGEKKLPDNQQAGGQVAKPSGDAPPPPQIVPQTR